MTEIWAFKKYLHITTTTAKTIPYIIYVPPVIKFSVCFFEFLACSNWDPQNGEKALLFVTDLRVNRNLPLAILLSLISEGWFSACRMPCVLFGIRVPSTPCLMRTEWCRGSICTINDFSLTQLNLEIYGDKIRTRQEPGNAINCSIYIILNPNLNLMLMFV